MLLDSLCLRGFVLEVIHQYQYGRAQHHLQGDERRNGSLVQKGHPYWRIAHDLQGSHYHRGPHHPFRVLEIYGKLSVSHRDTVIHWVRRGTNMMDLSFSML